MAIQPHPHSFLRRLAALPDPRVRKGRRYPLAALLGLVLLGMLHGHDSLRGAWVWADQRGACSGAHWAHALRTSRPTTPCATYSVAWISTPSISTFARGSNSSWTVRSAASELTAKSCAAVSAMERRP